MDDERETIIRCHCGLEAGTYFTRLPEGSCCIVCRCDMHALGECGSHCGGAR